MTSYINNNHVAIWYIGIAVVGQKRLRPTPKPLLSKGVNRQTAEIENNLISC